ncbi:hypothetical protein [Streptococcus sp. E17BB]
MRKVFLGILGTLVILATVGLGMLAYFASDLVTTSIYYHRVQQAMV